MLVTLGISEEGQRNMSNECSLLVERQGPTLVLTMNRVERRNALSLDMVVRHVQYLTRLRLRPTRYIGTT